MTADTSWLSRTSLSEPPSAASGILRKSPRHCTGFSRRGESSRSDRHTEPLRTSRRQAFGPDGRVQRQWLALHDSVRFTATAKGREFPVGEYYGDFDEAFNPREFIADVRAQRLKDLNANLKRREAPSPRRGRRPAVRRSWRGIGQSKGKCWKPSGGTLKVPNASWRKFRRRKDNAYGKSTR